MDAQLMWRWKRVAERLFSVLGSVPPSRSLLSSGISLVFGRRRLPNRQNRWKMQHVWKLLSLAFGRRNWSFRRVTGHLSNVVVKAILFIHDALSIYMVNKFHSLHLTSIGLTNDESKVGMAFKGETNIILADTNFFYGNFFEILSLCFMLFLWLSNLSLTIVYNIDCFNDYSVQHITSFSFIFRNNFKVPL